MPNPAQAAADSCDAKSTHGASEPTGSSQWTTVPREGSRVLEDGLPLEDQLDPAVPLPTPRDEACNVDIGGAALIPHSVPQATPSIVSSRWQLASLDLKQMVDNDASDPSMPAPRTESLSFSPALEPKVFASATPQKIPSKENPLADVLTWLGHSDLAKDQRFLPAQGMLGHADGDHDMERSADHDIQNGSPVAASTGDARELFTDIADEDLADVQQPRINEPKPANAQAVPGKEAGQCANLPPVCLVMMPGSTSELGTVDHEEKQWLERKMRTGTVGRLVIYANDENPRDDFLLRGGRGRPFVVTALAEGGPASKMGVKAGDRLISINGNKNFATESPESLWDCLRPPTMLVFCGFVGKLHAEVRLTCQHRLCGLPTGYEVARGYSDAPLQVCEETVFDAGIASLFLTVAEAQSRCNDEGPPVVQELTPLFELRRPEAYGIVHAALDESSAPSAKRPDAGISFARPGGDSGAPNPLEDDSVSRLIANVPRAAPLLTPRTEIAGVPSFLHSPRFQRNVDSSRTYVRQLHTPGPRATDGRPAQKNFRAGPDTLVGMCSECMIPEASEGNPPMASRG